MAVIQPFAALRPDPLVAARLCELPYDVLSAAEARLAAADNPMSFFRVSKAEIDLPPETHPYAPEVYSQAQVNFARLRSQGALVQDAVPAFYLYRQVQGAHVQTGLVALASCQDYLTDTIRRHELTRVDKEDDRVRHLEALQAQTGPAFLVYRAVRAIDELVARACTAPPTVDFHAPDGVRHTAWVVADWPSIEKLQLEFARIPRLYIADGHHRSAAAARVFRQRKGAGGSAGFLAVIFPHNQTQILPYHRVLKGRPELSPAGLLRDLEAFCTISPGLPPQPAAQHELALFLADQWHRLVFREEHLHHSDPVEQLDVSLLQRHVLAPLFGVADPRTSKQVDFVGGVRGTPELERLVQSGEFFCAFALAPTSIEDLMTIADAGRLMPPKSTWFEPKLRDGMFSHLF